MMATVPPGRGKPIPAFMPSVHLMLDQHRRQWTNINTVIYLSVHRNFIQGCLDQLMSTTSRPLLRFNSPVGLMVSV